MKLTQQLPPALEMWLVGVGILLVIIARTWLKRKIRYLIRIDPILGFLGQASSRGIHPDTLKEQVATYKSSGLLSGPINVQRIGWFLALCGLGLGVMRYI